MHRSILIVDHGSRRPEANQLVEDVARRVSERLEREGHAASVRTAHLEVVPPGVDEAIDACVADGAREIVIHPFFLAPGRHGSRDIPEAARRARERHPGVSIRVTATLGPHEHLVDIVLERLAEGAEGP